MADTKTTATTPLAHPYLTTGDLIEFKGELYVIDYPNPKNYRIKSKSTGKVYNLDRRAPVIHKGHEAVAPQTHEFPKFKDGDPVVITAKGKFNGVKGLVAKVNPTKYQVVIRNVGVLNVTHNAVKRDED